ncbi:zinc peptidase [Lactococcus lactis]|uniref:zinc peptidase n=1 Tax=Lactococcus lactis TaxID=1358 RepID=UPI0024A9FE32|nr:zinc peptidase [Lactococcus lactis]
MSVIKELLLGLSVKIKYYDPSDYPHLKDGMKFNIRGLTYIFIDIFNSEMVTQNILLHEMGHVSFGHRHLDCRSSGWDRKQEREADRYMIEYRADEWLAQFDWEPDIIDYDAFIEHFELEKRHYGLVVEVFNEIISHAQLDSCCL